MGRMSNPACVIYTDASRHDVGVLAGATLDLEVGDSDSFEVEAPSDYDISGGSLVYVDGTSLGGIVDHVVPTTGEPLVTYRGRTWAGILAERVVKPPPGSAYYEFDCDANALLRALVEDLGLGWLFEVPAGPSGVALSGRFDRYCDLWDGLRKAARASGARVSVTWGGAKAELTMVPRATYEANPSEAPATVDAPWRAVNHLVCLGKGQGASRVVRHIYADASGNVSATQSLFGADEREMAYEYTNAEAAELVEEGTKKLRELQERSSVTVDVSALDEDVALGDLVTATDDVTGATATAEVARIVARVEAGQLTMSCEAGSSAISGSVSLAGSSESSGGVTYSAGDGITISGSVISADVTGVKGSAEGSYRTGNVSLSAPDVDVLILSNQEIEALLAAADA